MANKNQTHEQTPQKNDEDLEKNAKKRRRVFNRRNFLIGGAIVLGGSAAALYFGRTPIRRQAAQIMGEMDFPHGINTLEPDFLFEMQEDNTLLMRVAKAEMGQGIFTGIAMLAAEELDVSLDQIKVVPNSTDSGMIDTLGTGGSNSTGSLYEPIRESAATFREMLKMAAAKQWSVDVFQVSTADGIVSAGSQQMSYIDVVNATSEWEIPETPALRPASSFKVVGTEQPRIDLKPQGHGRSPSLG